MAIATKLNYTTVHVFSLPILAIAGRLGSTQRVGGFIGFRTHRERTTSWMWFLGSLMLLGKCEIQRSGILYHEIMLFGFHNGTQSALPSATSTNEPVFFYQTPHLITSKTRKQQFLKPITICCRLSFPGTALVAFVEVTPPSITSYKSGAFFDLL